MALILISLPTLIIIPFGFLWLWQHHYLLIWFVASFLLSLLGWGWAYYLRQQQVVESSETQETKPHPYWTDHGRIAWQKVETLAENLDIDTYPLGEADKIFLLGKQVLEIVATHYHPDSDDPLWETPLPYILRVIELASADLRNNFVTQIPGSHILTVSDIFRYKRWTTIANRYYDVYRVVSAPVNPTSSLLRELKNLITHKIFNSAVDNTKAWLLRNYVKKVGYYAIELYSGTMVLDDIAFNQHVTKLSQKDLYRVETTPYSEEPLRILVLGQVKAGKSSLINALFGEVRAATDILPTTQRLTPYLLDREGIQNAVIFDSAGYEENSDSQRWFNSMEKYVLQSDFILLVCAAHTAARQSDKELLLAIRQLFENNIEFPVPPILVVLSHIDRLRPLREWQPPYDIVHPQRPKEQMIRAAMEALAQSLSVDLSHIIPVNLQPDHYYNIEEGIIPAMLNRLDDAKRRCYLRCVHSFKHEEDWQKIWAQALRAGQVVLGRVSNALLHRKKS